MCGLKEREAYHCDGNVCIGVLQDIISYMYSCIIFVSNLPAGVLFDLYANTEIPWELTVHFQHFPSQMLLKCATPSEIEHLYFHSLKQAVYLLHGSTRLFNELSVDAQRQLWQSVRISDHCAFLSVSEYLVNGGAESSAALRELKSLPIRVVRQDKPVVQRPVVPLLTSDAPTTSEARQKLLRDVLVLDLGAQLGISAETVDSFECVVHGIAVPMESPIFDLWKLMHHCDLFLYIIVRSALSS